jgi:proteasome accessory factor B
MGESFGIMSEGAPFTVRIMFTPRSAPYIAERTWHEHQTIEEKADGSLVLIFPATSIMEVKRWVLSWGADAKVLGPDELVAEVKEELKKADKVYG